MNDDKMFCPHCGKQISKRSKFCPYCGQKINVVTEVISTTNETNQNNEVPVENHNEQFNSTNYVKPVDEEIVSSFENKDQSVEQITSETNKSVNDQSFVEPIQSSQPTAETTQETTQHPQNNVVNNDAPTVNEQQPQSSIVNNDVPPVSGQHPQSNVASNNGSVNNEQLVHQGQQPSSSNNQAIKLEFTNNAFQNIFKWLAMNIYLTVISVFVLFIVFSFSRILGWILALVGLVAVYIIVSNQKVSSSNVENSIKGKVNQGVGTTLKETGQTVSQSVQKTVSNISSNEGQAVVSQGRWSASKIVFLCASIVTFLTSYIGPFVSASAFGLSVQSSTLAELLQSANTVNRGLSQFMNSSSDTSEINFFIILFIVGIGPLLGIIFSFMKSNKSPLIAGIIALIGYILLLTVFYDKIGSASQVFSPGLSCIIGLAGSITMIVCGIIIRGKKQKKQ